MLALLAFAYLVKTLPFFAPEDVFSRTNSRLQIPVDVLFNRLAAARPGSNLSLGDFVLRSKFVNLESRLLYLQFGPQVLIDCPFCTSDDPRSYLYYALPSLLWPHFTNALVLAIATSSTWTGRSGSQWRTLATIAAGIFCLADVYLVSSYTYQANALALRLPEIDFFYWNMRNYRLIGLAAVDAFVGWLIYLASTNRAFVQLPSHAERVEMVGRALMGVKSKVNAAGIVKNTALRDEELYSRTRAYWQHEVRLMQEVMEDKEVIDGVNDALANRIDIQNITRDADMYAQNVLEPLRRGGEED